MAAAEVTRVSRRERVGFAWKLTLAITHVAWVELRKPFEDDNSFLGKKELYILERLCTQQSLGKIEAWWLIGRL